MTKTVKNECSDKYICPSCYENTASVFYTVRNVSVHSVLLLETREQALLYPKGDLALGFCQSCGFVSNCEFDETLQEYSPKYESTQAYSSTFNRFSQNLAELLIERYDLHGKNIVEIGCGQGEFLSHLVQLGCNHGIGFDPAYDGARNYNTHYIPSSVVAISLNNDGSFKKDHHDSCKGCVTFIRDYYGSAYRLQTPDFICCKMTLEHIHNTYEFVSIIRDTIDVNSATVVFFQVPDLTRILDELAFWDIYYEHCSYFSSGSLARLFRACGFEVMDTWTDYDGQYLMIEARIKRYENTGSAVIVNDIEELKSKVDYFRNNNWRKIDAWKSYLNRISERDLKAVIWGSGSKAVSFLTTLKIHFHELEYVVDINPYRQGSYIAGTGQEIVSPERLRDYKPDVVIVMNPIYRDEIKNLLEGMNLKPEIVTVNDI